MFTSVACSMVEYMKMLPVPFLCLLWLLCTPRARADLAAVDCRSPGLDSLFPRPSGSQVGNLFPRIY
jgi:hypothetical protein